MFNLIFAIPLLLNACLKFFDGAKARLAMVFTAASSALLIAWQVDKAISLSLNFPQLDFKLGNPQDWDVLYYVAFICLFYPLVNKKLRLGEMVYVAGAAAAIGTESPEVHLVLASLAGILGSHQSKATMAGLFIFLAGKLIVFSSYHFNDAYFYFACSGAIFFSLITLIKTFQSSWDLKRILDLVLFSLISYHFAEDAGLGDGIIALVGILILSMTINLFREKHQYIGSGVIPVFLFIFLSPKLETSFFDAGFAAFLTLGLTVPRFFPEKAQKKVVPEGFMIVFSASLIALAFAASMLFEYNVVLGYTLLALITVFHKSVMKLIWRLQSTNSKELACGGILFSLSVLAYLVCEAWR